MNSPQANDQNRRLEHLIDGVLRAQPAMPAPHSLHARVLQAIELRAASPWWRKQFLYWPVGARLAFVLAALGFAKLTFNLTLWFAAGVQTTQVSQALPELSWLQTTQRVLGALGDFEVLLANSLPLVWIYGALFFVAALYSALFGLGAVAYRALYASR